MINPEQKQPGRLTRRDFIAFGFGFGAGAGAAAAALFSPGRSGSQPEALGQGIGSGRIDIGNISIPEEFATQNPYDLILNEVYPRLRIVTPKSSFKIEYASAHIDSSYGSLDINQVRRTLIVAVDIKGGARYSGGTNLDYKDRDIPWLDPAVKTVNESLPLDVIKVVNAAIEEKRSTRIFFTFST